MLQQVNTATSVSKHQNPEIQTVYEKSSAHSLTQCSTFTNAQHFNSAEYAPRNIWTVGWVSPTVWTWGAANSKCDALTGKSVTEKSAKFLQ